MSHRSQSLPRAAMRGIASGVLFLAFFGTFWSLIGVGGLHGWGAPWLLIVALLIGVTLLGGGVSLWRGAERLAKEAIPEADTTGRWFGIIFAAEGIAIGIASYLCNVNTRYDLFFPIMAIIVGLHFLPLARLFGVTLYYGVGVLLCLLGIIALLVVPETVTLAAREMLGRSLLVGFGAAVILWATGLTLWRRGAQALRTASSVARRAMALPCNGAYLARRP